MRLRLRLKIPIILVAFISLIGSSPVQAMSAPTEATSSTLQPVIEASVPVEYAPSLISESAVLMDAESGQILYGKNMDEILYPASITKIMTGLLALEQGKLDDIITMSDNAVFSVERGSSHIALDVGEQISMHDALYALAIASANDAANGIAEHISGTIDQFAIKMNERAKMAGALNTNFSNANGLPDPTHLTTARDMAFITRAAVNTPGWTTYFCTSHYEIPPTNIQKEARDLYSYNSFINGERCLEGVVACKTGYTDEAFHTLVTVVRRNNRTLIAVIMKSEPKAAKWDDTEALIEYGFSQFRSVNLESDDFPQETIEVTDDKGQPVTAKLQVTQPVQLWIHQTVKMTDLQLTLLGPDSQAVADLDQAKVAITLGEKYADRMSTELIQVAITPQFEVDHSTSALTASGKKSSSRTRDISTWLVALLIVFLSFGLIFAGVIIYAVRQRNIKRRRRRERLAALRRNYQENQMRYR